jgi:AraC-like DNA-binding protein
MMIETRVRSDIKENIQELNNSGNMYLADELKTRAKNLESLMGQPAYKKEALKEQVRTLFQEVARLKSRIEFLERENEQRFIKEINTQDFFQPNEVSIPSFDEKLFKKALLIIEENISNEFFNISAFCSELGVSRTLLFLKVKTWTNFTPNDLIKHYRMRRAVQLLEKGKMIISEVSYHVGYKNPKYFSMCFSEKFGLTPSQFQKKYAI